MSLDYSISCPHCGQGEDFNITHNLAAMARDAGIYEILWHPEKMNPQPTAFSVAMTLESAIALMWADPARFKLHDAPNGWGIYDHFMPWLEKVARYCRDHPDFRVSASR